ncbi:MAG TPA: PA2169 family four-helix-bundle protein [Acidobacteriaceae bacterium]|jgi:uncharacterized protein (TIGR02284 family)|nr:PA2169 family four-helix-bundle protein [Acidobacteriaceae bacterium]
MPEHIALDKVESSLKELIETLRGSQEGYQEFGARLHDPRAKRLFLEETQRRAEYAAELENELHRMGVHDVKEGVSPTAKLRHLWGEIQAHLSGDQALLSAAEKSDDVARKAYASTLKQELPLPLREMLDRQLAHIERSHAELRTLHDLK